MGIAKILTFVTGLVAVIWSTTIQSASLQADGRPKSSLILNESFIQSKILQRYHLGRGGKDPRVLLKLPEHSGIHGTASTLQPVSPLTSKTTESTKAVYNEFRFSPIPSSKQPFRGEKLIFESGNNNRYVGSPSSTESTLQASSSQSSEETESQEEDYSASELSEEELKAQQTEYNINPWLDGGRKNALNSLLTNYYSNDKTQPESSEEQDNTSDTDEDPFVSTTKPSLVPQQNQVLVNNNNNRRIDTDETPQFNGLYINLGFPHRFQASQEVEKSPDDEDNNNNRYFIKTIPKDSISVSVSPIVDYTSTTPFTIIRGPPGDSSTEIQNNLTQQGNLSGTSFYSSSSDEVLNRFLSRPSTATSSDFATATEKSDEDFAGHGHVSPHVSSLEISGGTTTPSPSSSTNTANADATSIPGVPGVDYPILSEIPFTGFDCQLQRYKGFFADVDTKCQAWHYCDFTDGHSTFLCPNGTLFSQVLLTCDWWFKVDCSQAQQLYVLNERLYRYIKPPKPSFPEDFHGPQVDLWLVQQLQLGLLPKMRKKITDKVVINN
ncbi:unnamed protein product [Allacma fusca]|uniref:Chitin-binding type-2 domain-containing protein n=1 Tax=Allacma fusca TaxID=39272 RepID=A0A8J2NZS4_9HEXA|nr:unnamed protein product [Allacma fusca]